MCAFILAGVRSEWENEALKILFGELLYASQEMTLHEKHLYDPHLLESISASISN